MHWTILLLVAGMNYVYQAPLLTQHACTNKPLYRYHFGVYQIDQAFISGAHSYKQIYGWKHFLGFDPVLCAEQIEYDQCVMQEKQAALKKQHRKINSGNAYGIICISMSNINWFLKLPYANRCSMFLSDNIQVDQSLSISNNRFYIHLTFGEESEPSLTEILDAVNFQQLHPTNLYKDKEHVYLYFDMLDSGNSSILEDADYATFKTKSDVGCVAKDK